MGICAEEKFKNVFLQYNTRLQRFLQSKGLNTEEAADMAQDVFMKLWKNCAQVIESSVLSYIFTLANNQRIDEARKVKVRLKFQGQLSNQSNTITPQYSLEEKEFKTKIEDALSSMSLASREVFMMNRFDDMRYADIATTLGISTKAVEKRMSKALNHLRENGILKKK